MGLFSSLFARSRDKTHSAIDQLQALQSAAAEVARSARASAGPDQGQVIEAFQSLASKYKPGVYFCSLMMQLVACRLARMDQPTLLAERMPEDALGRVEPRFAIHYKMFVSGGQNIRDARRAAVQNADGLDNEVLEAYRGFSHIPAPTQLYCYAGILADHMAYMLRQP